MEEIQRALRTRDARPRNYLDDEHLYGTLPFLNYSSCFWFSHSKEVEMQKLSPEELLSSSWKPSGRVVQSWSEALLSLSWKPSVRQLE